MADQDEQDGRDARERAGRQLRAEILKERADAGAEMFERLGFKRTQRDVDVDDPLPNRCRLRLMPEYLAGPKDVHALVECADPADGDLPFDVWLAEFRQLVDLHKTGRLDEMLLGPPVPLHPATLAKSVDSSGRGDGGN
jgi:hypothetical protein